MTQKIKRGLIHDSISDMLTRIRNACLAKKSTVSIPFTRMNQQIAQILEKEGFINNFQITLNAFENPLLRDSMGLAAPVLTEGTTTTEASSSVGTLVERTQPDSMNSFQNAEITIRLKYKSKTIYKGKVKECCITNLKRISKPGLRIYANTREIPRVLGGTGIVIVSTPEGVMTDREARLRGIGGELLCTVW